MQKLATLPVIIGLITAAGTTSAQAGGLIEDAKATLKLRNFYINTDNRDSAAPANANYQEEWGQGFQLDLQSGYTDGTVGFGVDAIGLLGVKLDSGKGRHGNPTGGSYGGTVFPSDGNAPVDDFSSLGLTAKAKISSTELRVGALQPKLPVISFNDGRLLPQTFEGYQITSADISNLSLVAGQIEHVKGRNSSNTEGLSIAGANNSRTGEFSNKFIYGGADYKVTKDLLAQYYYGNLEDFYRQHFLGLVHSLKVGPGTLKTDVRYFHSTDDGQNGNNTAYYTTGYYGGNTVKGKVDNDLYGALFSYTLGSHILAAGYQVSSGDSDFPWLNQGDGSSNYSLTDVQIQKFGRAGEKTWQARYTYDFAALGLPGATANIAYLSGDSIDHPTGDKKEWERDITLSYVVPEGELKGFGVQVRNGVTRNNIPNQRDQDETRVILSYTLTLL